MQSQAVSVSCAEKEATSLCSGRQAGMTTSDAQWFDLAEDHGVLELHERFTCGVGLELHLVTDSETGETIAWWEREGEWFAVADVGRA